jgi:hypothetical protein
VKEKGRKSIDKLQMGNNKLKCLQKGRKGEVARGQKFYNKLGGRAGRGW